MVNTSRDLKAAFKGSLKLGQMQRLVAHPRAMGACCRITLRWGTPYCACVPPSGVVSIIIWRLAFEIWIDWAVKMFAC